MMGYRSPGEKGSWANGLRYLVDLRRVPSSLDYTQCALSCTILTAETCKFVTAIKLQGQQPAHKLPQCLC
jgi:hypothetical protein